MPQLQPMLLLHLLLEQLGGVMRQFVVVEQPARPLVMAEQHQEQQEHLVSFCVLFCHSLGSFV